MTEPIVSIARIEQQAREAAATYDNVNDACPYSFYTEAGRLFKRTFVSARLAKNVVAKPERGQSNATTKQVRA